MGADFCLSILTWDNNTKLKWRAGYTAIKNLPKKIWDEWDKPEIVQALKDIEEAVKHGSRESSTMEIGHLEILITGGMTWGDSPSDLYRALSVLEQIDDGAPASILKTVGFNLDELNYKTLLMKVLDRDPKNLPLYMGLDPHLDKILTAKLKR